MHSAALQRRGGLLDQAEAALQRALAADPHNAKALLRLGDILRSKGNFSAALDVFRRLCALEPDNAKAFWLSAILGGDRLPSAPPPGRRAVPFVRLKDFLPPPEQERLFRLTLAGSQWFTRASVESSDFIGVSPQIRAAWMAHTQTELEARPLIAPRLRRLLPGVLARLGEEVPDGYKIEINLTAHLDGGYFRPHRDNGPKFLRPRMLSYVYYFHRKPKRFSGGDLLLYDTAPESEEGDAGFHAFFRVRPRHNSLVVFPSGYFHEITPVECGTRDFADGRFTVNGWVRRSKSGDGGAGHAD